MPELIRIATINRHTLMGIVTAGGKITYFANGGSSAGFHIMTDSYKPSGDGGSERFVEYHRVQVTNRVFDDLEDLMTEGNVVFIEGPKQSYEKNSTRFEYTKAETCSLIARPNSKKKQTKT